MARFLKIVVLLAILCGGGYKLWQRYKQLPAAPDAGAMAMMGGPAPVGVAKVVARDLRLWNEFSGRLSAVDSAVVRPRVSGTIETVHFKDGAMVKKGDLLFTIDQRSYKAEVAKAEGQMAAAQASASSARRESDRADKLMQERALPQRDYDLRKSDAAVANASIRTAQAALESAKLNLDYTEVRAPISGRVGRAEITLGNLVEAGMGAAPALTTIVSDDMLYADFDMDERTFLRYVGATAGDVTQIPVEMSLATGDAAPRLGHVASFDNQLSATSGTIRVRAVFDNADHTLVPGLFAHLRVGGAGETHVLLITDRAVGTDQNKKFVLVVGADNKVEYREVKLGALAGDLRIVEEGLKEGEQIIVSGLQRARPGMPVVPELVDMNAKEAPPGAPPAAEQAAPPAAEAPKPAETKAEETKAEEVLAAPPVLPAADEKAPDLTASPVPAPAVPEVKTEAAPSIQPPAQDLQPLPPMPEAPPATEKGAQ